MGLFHKKLKEKFFLENNNFQLIKIWQNVKEEPQLTICSVVVLLVLNLFLQNSKLFQTILQAFTKSTNTFPLFSFYDNFRDCVME